MSDAVFSSEAASPGAVAAPAAKPVAPDPLGLVPTGPPVLLVVDDQPANVQALYRVFAADHQVLMATRPEQALRLCRERLPDLVLLDLVMPGMDGYEVCQRLKADPATCDIPVIFVTGQHDEQVETRCLEVGGVDFISKPFNPRIVRARVRTHVLLKRHADRLLSLAFLDGLTGVYNRRGFDERLRAEYRRTLRHSRPLALLMVDVDHFKAYNDHYGHLPGDDVLRQVAATIAASVRRPGDLVARYGGEEFVCILPETTREGAQVVAEAIVQAVQALGVPHARSPIMPVLTVSVGVAAMGPDLRGVDQAGLLAWADHALYLAKHSGRNRACSADRPAPDAAAAGPMPQGH